MQKMLLFLVILGTPALSAQNSAKKFWYVSLASLTAANVVDIQSSWGKPELNRALASSNGSFGARGALLKSGFHGGLMGLEALLMHRHPSQTLRRFLTVVNFGATAVVAGAAAHNYRIPQH